MSTHSLNEGWRIQSSAAVGTDGAALSRPGVPVAEWYAASLPATVLGAIVESGEYGDVMAGDRLLDIPGHGPRAENFSNFPMPDDSPFRVPWWFRTEFRVPASALPFSRLRLDGVNYRANVWLNGELLAGSDEIVGAYRVFELDVTARLRRDAPNALAIEVLPPRPCDLALSWVDWNPGPPDKNMGLWRDVSLVSSGPIALRDPHVVTALDDDGSARLRAGGDVVNVTDQPQRATVCAVLAGRRVVTSVALQPGERRRFELPEVHERSPRLWWPRQLGEPALHELRVDARVDGILSDAARHWFGIREVTTELTDDGHALFRVNGRPLLIRGAGWASDLFLRRQPERERAMLDYALAMNLNTIRFEGMLERNEVLEWCDREGMLVIAGWCCCDCWEKWADWTSESVIVAMDSLRSQLRRVRRHPSMIAWWYGSDFPPPADVERAYLDVVREVRWPNPTCSSAANKPTEVTGQSGVKMEGPYDYVPPNYWYEDTVRGGAFGFATEICPGPAIPPIESLRTMLTAEHLWPIDDVWKLHAGGKEFHNIDAFLDAVTGRFGEVSSAEELAELSQLMTYEAQRAMFEAYTRNRYRATGVIQWMLNNAWPSLIWHLFDYYLRPGGGYFGTKKACAPLHVLYAYDTREVVAVNDTGRPRHGLRAGVRAWTPGGALTFHHTAGVDLDDGASATVCAIPPPADGEPVQLVELRLFGADGHERVRNFYWVPAVLDELDHPANFWIRTPVRRHADLRALRSLPPAQVAATAVRVGDRVRVRAHNRGDQLALFIQLRLADERGRDVLPVLWDDNYVSIPPGEDVAIDARIPAGAAAERVAFTGLNVRPFAVPVELPAGVPARLRDVDLVPHHRDGAGVAGGVDRPDASDVSHRGQPGPRLR